MESFVTILHDAASSVFEMCQYIIFLSYPDNDKLAQLQQEAAGAVGDGDKLFKIEDANPCHYIILRNYDILQFVDANQETQHQVLSQCGFVDINAYQIEDLPILRQCTLSLNDKPGVSILRIDNADRLSNKLIYNILYNFRSQMKQHTPFICDQEPNLQLIITDQNIINNAKQ